VKTFQRDFSGYDTVFGHPDPLTLVPKPSDYVEHTMRYKPEVETVPQTGSTNNLATETDIDEISMAILMFWGSVFTGAYVDFALHFFPQNFQDGRRIPEVVITLREKMIPS